MFGCILNTVIKFRKTISLFDVNKYKPKSRITLVHGFFHLCDNFCKH